MDLKEMERKISLTQDKLDTILTKTDDFLLHPDIISTVLEELSIAVEELQVQHEELINTNQELEWERQRYQELFEFAPDAYLVTDTKGIIKAINQVGETLFQISRNSAIGKPLAIFVEPKDHRKFYTYLSQLDSSPSLEIQNLNFTNEEIYLKPRRGKSFPSAIAVSPVYNNRGELNGLRWLIRDITQQKRTEETLHQAKEMAEIANQAKEEFLSTISHEIRNPMTPIIGFCGLLLRGRLTKQQRQYVTYIDSNARKILNLMSDILDFAKISAGKLILKEIPFNFRAFLKETLAQFTPQLEENKLQLSSFVDPNIPEIIIGDLTRIAQIIVNLVSNAIKFTDEGEITISVKIADSTLDSKLTIEFAVKDTGIGIASDKLNQIFQRFCQIDSSTKRSYGGTGLGLAIAQKLSENMGGKIWVESEINQGTTFYFTIVTNTDQPLLSSDDISINPEPEKSSNSIMLKVLLAEDDHSNQDLVFYTLEDEGVVLDVVSNGLEAVEAAQNNFYDVILMDLNMPIMNGLKATRLIRQQEEQLKLEITEDDPPFNPSRIIGLTALVTPEIQQDCLEAGMNDCFNKPFSFNQLN
jgi:PAS domain S-box-containing protein